MSTEKLLELGEAILVEAGNLTNQGQTLQAEVNSLQNLLKEKETHLVGLDQEEKSIQEETEELKKQIEEINEEIRRLDERKTEWMKEQESLEKEVEELGGSIEEEMRAAEEAEIYAEEVGKIVARMKSLEASLAGYKKSLSIISKWIPAQQENVDVLIALSEYESLPKEDLARQAGVSPLILERTVMPKLLNAGIVEENNGRYNLKVQFEKEVSS